jgi:hypothetical protein
VVETFSSPSSRFDGIDVSTMRSRAVKIWSLLVTLCGRCWWYLVDVDFGREVKDSLDGVRWKRLACHWVDVHVDVFAQVN